MWSTNSFTCISTGKRPANNDDDIVVVGWEDCSWSSVHGGDGVGQAGVGSWGAGGEGASSWAGCRAEAPSPARGTPASSGADDAVQGAEEEAGGRGGEEIQIPGCSFVHSFVCSVIRFFICSFSGSFIRSVVRSLVHSGNLCSTTISSGCWWVKTWGRWKALVQMLNRLFIYLLIHSVLNFFIQSNHHLDEIWSSSS